MDTNGTIDVGGGSLMELLRLFRDGRRRTRAEVMEESGRARSTLTPQLDALVAHGLLLLDGVAESTGGRRPAAFVLNPNSHLILAVDVGPQHLRVGLYNLAGDILALEEKSAPMEDDPEVTFDQIEVTTRSLLSQDGVSGTPIAAVGVGLPTPVGDNNRPMHPPLKPLWHDFDVAGRMRLVTEAPVLVERDNNLRALAEATADAGDHGPSVLYVHVSDYLGSGLVLDGRLARGAGGSAGYFGHISGVWSNDQLCRCGKLGCLEAVASSWAVLRDFGPELGVSTTAELVALAASGSGRAKQALNQAGQYIGQGIANFVSVINPARIVVGGSMTSHSTDVLGGIRQTVYSSSYPLPSQLLTVESARLGHLSALTGAYVLSRDAYFAS